MNNKTIGEIIEREVRKQQIPITQFADMICCQRNNVYDIFRRSKIDIILLKRIWPKGDCPWRADAAA